LKGKLKITFGKKLNNLKNKVFKPNEIFTVNPKTIHRMFAIENSLYLEASTPELLDVVRLKDDYNR